MRNKSILTIILFSFILLGLIFRNIQFASIPFFDWDEGIYAQVATEIISNQSLSTTFNGETWLNKPPLTHLLIALCFVIFGKSEFWARMIMVFFAFALLMFTYLLSRKLLLKTLPNEAEKLSNFHKEIVFIIPVLALASTPLFIERAIVLNTDIMLAVGWLAYFLFSGFKNKLLALTFSVFTKSIVGFYPALISIITLKKSDFIRSNLYRAFALLIIPLIWHLISFLRFGNYFIQAHVFDQVIKRVLSPIELHFGNKFYYLVLYWKNTNILGIIIAITLLIIGIRALLIIIKQYKKTARKSYLWIYASIIIISGLIYIVPGISSNIIIGTIGAMMTITAGMHLFVRSQLTPPYNDELPSLIIYLSPIPFFALLMISQSKISWYMITLLPLFFLSLSYFYVYIKNTYIRVVFLIILVLYFSWTFFPSTYFFNSSSYLPTNRIKLAKCISSQSGKSIAFLVSPQERQNQNVVEAAKLQTTTSFLYGGSPSFVYYPQKKVEHFYKVELFEKNYQSYDIISFNLDDQNNLKTIYPTIKKYFKKDCEGGNWVSYSKI